MYMMVMMMMMMMMMTKLTMTMLTMTMTMGSQPHHLARRVRCQGLNPPRVSSHHQGQCWHRREEGCRKFVSHCRLRRMV